MCRHPRPGTHQRCRGRLSHLAPLRDASFAHSSWHRGSTHAARAREQRGGAARAGQLREGRGAGAAGAGGGPPVGFEDPFQNPFYILRTVLKSLFRMLSSLLNLHFQAGAEDAPHVLVTVGSKQVSLVSWIRCRVEGSRALPPHRPHSLTTSPRTAAFPSPAAAATSLRLLFVTKRAPPVERKSRS